MSKFLIKLTKVAFLLVFLCFAIQTLINFKIKDKKQYTLQNDWHLLMGVESSIIFLGNSRVAEHINPAIVDNIFDTDSYLLTQDGQNLEFFYVKLKNYLAYNIPPKELYCQFDRSILKPIDDLYGFNNYSMFFYNDFMDLTLLSDRKGFRNLYRYIPALAVSPSMLIKILFSSEIAQEQRFLNTKGFVPNKADPVNFDNIPKWSYKINTDKIAFLDSLYDITHRHAIDLYLFNPPQTYVTYKKIINQEILENIVLEKNIKYNRDIIFVDFNSERYSNFSLFSNHTHLNKKGSDIFTKELVNDKRFFKQFRIKGSVY